MVPILRARVFHGNDTLIASKANDGCGKLHPMAASFWISHGSIISRCNVLHAPHETESQASDECFRTDIEPMRVEHGAIFPVQFTFLTRANSALSCALPTLSLRMPKLFHRQRKWPPMLRLFLRDTPLKGRASLKAFCRFFVHTRFAEAVSSM